MKIDAHHPVYDRHVLQWEKCRDAYDGEDAVKAKGTRYLPRGSMSDSDYRSYLTRAPYFEAVGRTVDGYCGAIARKAHVFNLPDSLTYLQDDATDSGVGLDEFIKTLCKEAFLLSRAGVLVDLDDNERPYLVLVRGEDITNWGSDFVIYRDFDYVENDNGEIEEQELYRLVEPGRVTLYTREKGEGELREIATYPLLRRGIQLTGMPFFWVSAHGATSNYTRPPMLGLVNTAIHHFQLSADLAHGRYFAGSPTLFTTGFSSGEPLAVGASQAIQIPNEGARVGYAEFTGQGLGSLEKGIQEFEQQLAVLGSAAFHEQSVHSSGVYQNVLATQSRGSAQTSLIASVVTSVEACLSRALAFASDWTGAGPVSIALNREFLGTSVDPQTITALIAGVQTGAVSPAVLAFALEKSDLVPPGMDVNAAAKTPAVNPEAASSGGE